jgi:hypothetical protein
VKRIAAILAAIAIVTPAMRSAAWAAGKSAKSKAEAKDDAQTSSDPYQRLCKAYLDGKWDDLEKDLKPGKEPPGWTAEQRVEAAAMRAALAECRPAWWQSCKAGLKGQIHPVVWGRTLDATYDPATGKPSVQLSATNNRLSLTVSWPAADMDNGQHAEHGYSKGDLNDLSVWCILGSALTWTQISLQSAANLGEKERLGLARYQDFRGDVTGLYYGTPKARRWGEFLYLLSWKEMYAKMPIVYARKANGAAFLVEVLTDPAKYPSLPVPKNVPAENAEEKLAEQYRGWIEKHGWTVAEDVALRKAIQKFAAANNDAVLLREKQLVTLPNKLKISLDPAGDASLRPERDAWLKKQLDKWKP